MPENYTHVPRISTQNRRDPSTIEPNTLTYGVQAFVIKVPSDGTDGVIDTGIPLPRGIIQTIDLNIITAFADEQTNFTLFQKVLPATDTVLSPVTTLSRTGPAVDPAVGFFNIPPNGVPSTGLGNLAYRFDAPFIVLPITAAATADAGASVVFTYTGLTEVLIGQIVVLQNMSVSSYDGTFTVTLDGSNTFKVTLAFNGGSTGEARLDALERVVDSVTDNGGQAQFDYTGAPAVFVGQVLVLSDFGIGDFNGTFVVTAASSTTFEIGETFQTEASPGLFLYDVEAAVNDDIELIVAILTDLPTNVDGIFSDSPINDLQQFSHFPLLSTQDRPNTPTNNVDREYGFQTYTFKLPAQSTTASIDTGFVQPDGIVFDVSFNVLSGFGASVNLTLNRSSAGGDLATIDVNTAGYKPTVINSANENITRGDTFHYQYSSNTVDPGEVEVEVNVTVFTSIPIEGLFPST